MMSEFLAQLKSNPEMSVIFEGVQKDSAALASTSQDSNVLMMEIS